MSHIYSRMGRNVGCGGMRGAVAMTEVTRGLQTEVVLVEEAKTGRLVILNRTFGEKRLNISAIWILSLYFVNPRLQVKHKEECQTHQISCDLNHRSSRLGRNVGREGVRGAVTVTEVARGLQTEAVLVEEAQTG